METDRTTVNDKGTDDEEEVGLMVLDAATGARTPLRAADVVILAWALRNPEHELAVARAVVSVRP